MSEREKKITYRAPLSRWKALADLATNKESSIQQLIDDALDVAYFRAGGAHVGTRAASHVKHVEEPIQHAKHAKEHEALDVILDSGVLPYIRAIIYNLDGWSNAAKGVFPPGVAESATTREIMDPAEIIAEIEELTGKPLEGGRKRKKSA